MSFFCKHNWIEVARTYQPSQFELFVNAGANEVSTALDTESYTTILWRCEFCQRTKKERLLGKLVKE